MKTVLYIEDDGPNMELVRRYLRGQQEYHLEEAVTGGEGLTLAINDRPDIILLDLYLPDISGLEVAERIREMPEMASIPIIALTTDDRPEIRRMCETVGINAFLGKPFSAMKLLEMLDSFTG